MIDDLVRLVESVKTMDSALLAVIVVGLGFLVLLFALAK